MPNVKLSPYILKADKLETQENKTLIIDKNSTNEQYPSAKAVYDALQNVEGSGSVEIDQTYNSESKNAQSGIAIQGLVETLNSIIQDLSDRVAELENK